MLARWYLLLGQFSVTFEHRPGAQHVNADGMSRQCGQCRRPDCPVSSADSLVAELDACWDSAASGFTHYPCTLSGSEENSMA